MASVIFISLQKYKLLFGNVRGLRRTRKLLYCINR